MAEEVKLEAISYVPGDEVKFCVDGEWYDAVIKAVTPTGALDSNGQSSKYTVERQHNGVTGFKAERYVPETRLRHPAEHEAIVAAEEEVAAAAAKKSKKTKTAEPTVPEEPVAPVAPEAPVEPVAPEVPEAPVVEPTPEVETPAEDATETTEEATAEPTATETAPVA